MTELLQRLHFIGIGGIGVSAVARIAIGRGFVVSGSDVRRSQLTDAMQELGARVVIGHDPANIEGVDMVVVSTAIPEHNVELKAAREKGVPVIHRSEVLASFVAATPQSIGVTGTHGKGTTSAMIARILDVAGRDPGFIIGGLLNDYGINARAGGGEVLVAEVDESDGSHRNVSVTHLICNYLEADHLNFYDDLDAIIEAMRDAIMSYERLERVFVNTDCAGNRRLIDLIDRPVTTYGLEGNPDWKGTLVRRAPLPVRFRVAHKGEDLGEFEMPLPGGYNVQNALAALAVTASIGVDIEDARRALADFHGLENRFTIVEAAGVHIVKDYNSHPTAMRKVLQNARELGDGRIYSVFKPYRYTLINYLKDEYATAFVGSDQVVITEMYAANEDPIPGIDTQFFVRMLEEQGHEVAYLADQERICEHLEALVEPGDIVLFFGGDDFFAMADAWAEERKS